MPSRLLINFVCIALSLQYGAIGALGSAAHHLDELFSSGLWLEKDLGTVWHRHGANSQLHVHYRPASKPEQPKPFSHTRHGSLADREDQHAPHDCYLLSVIEQLGNVAGVRAVLLPIESSRLLGPCEVDQSALASRLKANPSRGPPSA